MTKVKKIPMSKTDKKKIRRELRGWESELDEQEIQLKSYEKQLDENLPVLRTKNQIEQAKEQIKLNEANIQVWEEQLKRDTPIKGLRKKIRDIQDKIDQLKHNVGIRKKELKDGFLRDINTGDFITKEGKKQDDRE